MNVHIVTCSYRPDYHLCKMLCDSIDELVPDHIRHTIIVPSRDYRLFHGLSNRRRTIAEAEMILPSSLTRVPFSQKFWIYENYWPLRGWYVQQLLKFSIPTIIQEDIIIHVDSDIYFIRPFDETKVKKDNKVRLYALPSGGMLETHFRWHHSASLLLGLPETTYFGSDFIGPLTTWRTQTVVALQRYLEARFSEPWQRVLARRRGWSEYIIYGVYVKHLLQDVKNHYLDPCNMCHCAWDYNLNDPNDLNIFMNKLEPRHIAVLIQSHEKIDIDTRKRIKARFIKLAA